MEKGSLPLLLRLPNEILLRALGTFRTNELLPLTCVCFRFHDLILRILHSRLLAAASLSQHKLILECYHPASKSVEPILFCDYLGTPGLSSEIEGAGYAYQSDENVGRLGKLANLYSRFRPIPLEQEYRIFAPSLGDGVPLARGDELVSSAEAVEAEASTSDARDREDRLVEHNIHLDIDEPFSQLCVLTNLVRLGPRRGVFLNLVHVSDGVIRVKRNWLASRAAARKSGQLESAEERTLWMDSRGCVGLKVHVDEKTWKKAVPVLMLRDEDPAVSYKVQYEELLVRTTRLLLAVEEALLRDYSTSSGKAMIFGSFVRASPA